MKRRGFLGALLAVPAAGVAAFHVERLVPAPEVLTDDDIRRAAAKLKEAASNGQHYTAVIHPEAMHDLEELWLRELSQQLVIFRPGGGSKIVRWQKYEPF